MSATRPRSPRRPAVAALLAAALLCPLAAVPAEAAESKVVKKKLKDRYVVTFDRFTTKKDIAFAREGARGRGGKFHFDYDFAVKGFAATLPAKALAGLRDDPHVISVEPDRQVQATDTQTPATWGLDRIDEQTRALNNRYTYTKTGAGVTAYVIDSGVRAGHSQFGGRVANGFNAIEGEDSGKTADCNGHGTHVAGTIGSSSYGVAKAVTIVPVRVLDCDGSGYWSEVIAGIDWVTEHHVAGTPAVANMSLGGGTYSPVDNAVATSIADGITYAISAGNDNENACNASPARVSSALTVGATTRTDARASFSNYGSCVDLFAPGVDITSTWNSSNSATNTISGTSMASPHVAGVAATLLEGTSGSIVNSALVSGATSGLISGVGSGSPNKLLYSVLTPVTTPPPGNQAPVTVAPAAVIASSGRIGTSTVPLTVSWSGSDPDSGDSVARYELQKSTNGGSSWSNVTLPSGTQTSILLDLASSANLRFRVRAVDTYGVTGSYATAQTIALALVAQSSSAVQYPSGSWSTSSVSGASGGSIRQSRTSGASVRLSFTGTQVDWIGTPASNRGLADVFLDGNLVATVDENRSSTWTRSILYSVTNLDAGSHTLLIVRKSGQSTSRYIDVDAFVTLR